MFYEYSAPLFTHFPLEAEFKRRIGMVPALWDHYQKNKYEDPRVSIFSALELDPLELGVSDLSYATEVYRKASAAAPAIYLVRAHIPFIGDQSLWTLSPGETLPSYILERIEDVDEEILYGEIYERELILSELNTDVTRAKICIQARLEEVVATLNDFGDQIEQFNAGLPDLIAAELEKAHKPLWPKFQ